MENKICWHDSNVELPNVLEWILCINQYKNEPQTIELLRCDLFAGRKKAHDYEYMTWEFKEDITHWCYLKDLNLPEPRSFEAEKDTKPQE